MSGAAVAGPDIAAMLLQMQQDLAGVRARLNSQVNTAEGLFEVPAGKLAKLRRLAVGLRVTAKKNRRLVQKRELAQLCGFAQSVKLALTPAPLFLRNFYDDLAQPVGGGGTSAVIDWALLRGTRSGSAPVPRYALDFRAAAAPPVVTNLLVKQLQAAAPGQDHSARLEQIAAVIVSRVGSKTWQSYASHFAAFVRFCVSEDLEFLPASRYTGLLWAQYLAARGSVRARTAQPYFSAVNTVHDLLGLAKPCDGDNVLLSAFRRVARPFRSTTLFLFLLVRCGLFIDQAVRAQPISVTEMAMAIDS
ncbi:hypothetical protein VOLCADRAFT_88894 [Volvox carteri f. nagariensis]|uniref:Uncharacterized protein n=1 Tax=Volvox carteri f. nagariensis TaxID=3068 RepID=D8TQ85_VOLCA|nr:uncharacterized protein VOLCADRAFT_88894 [Volvox carteri f. nagariensis]EFJ50361.1 hypothetical protein VOLCADRAFT_88894 [Volvox carteri f. nagariensis]|eukprot:XP_002948486.1 hypothetical protein VOLCADRAFT_88894 [Volvox carteri f. nagariensis]